nr:hypothetical protein [Tanacetum cinerariifolium]
MNRFKECSSCGALYNKSFGCSKGGFVDKFVHDPNKTPDLSQQPPHDCLKCGHPIDGLYCRQCALLRKKLKEDPNEKSLQSPPHIDHHCCYGCGESLDGIFCHQCICESCGSGARYGYNCSPKVPIMSNLEPCLNQNVYEFPQTLPSFHPTFYFGDENSFAYDSTPNFVNDSPNVFIPPSQPPMDSYKFCGNDAHYTHDCPPQVPFIYNPKPCYNQDFNFPQNLQSFQQQYPCCRSCGGPHETFQCQQELAEYINTPNWNRPAFYNYDDDDEDYTIAITPVVSTEEPVDSLIREDEHLDTIPAAESDEVIKFSVEDLVSIPSESEGIPDNMCDVPFHDNSLPLDISKDQFDDSSDSNDDSTSIDDDYFSIDDIDYVEAAPSHSELVSLGEVQDFHPKDGEIEDNILREKLSKINLLIAKIESLNDNPAPDRVLESPSPFPIPVEDSDSFFEKSDTSLSYSDNSLPKFETFSNHTEETSSGSTTTHADYSLPKYDSFIFEIDPD